MHSFPVLYASLYATFLIGGFYACAPVSETELLSFSLGQTTVEVTRTDYGAPAGIYVVHLHDNEATGIRAAEKVLPSIGGTLISLRNRNQRLLQFSYLKRAFAADPNRIFTEKGRRHTLEKWSMYNAGAAAGLETFASSLLNLLPTDQIIVSMHNNTDKAYSILSYLKGEALALDADSVHRNSAQDTDDFFLTTNKDIYSRLKEANYNVVLQDNEGATDDGSLSVYYRSRPQAYVNIEAEHGHFDQQVVMLQLLAQIIQ